MTSQLSKTVVFIHGAWMTPECWTNFRQLFAAAGYTTHAPTWPFLGGGASPAELRQNPPPGLGSLTVPEIADHYQAYIEKLPERPILVGHSFGGLVTQILLDRGFGSAGVAIDPGPIAGVIPGPTSLLGALPILLRWNAWKRPFTLSPAQFAKTFANTAPAALQNDAYEKLMVPTSGRIFFQAAAGVGTAVDPKRRTQPLLITVAEKDLTVTPYLARAAYKKQKASAAQTDFKEFPGLSHFLIAEPGWEVVANYVLDWLKQLPAK